MGPGGTEDYLTVAYGPATGHQRWMKTYNGPGGNTNRAYSVAVSPSGGTVYVTGASAGTDSTSISADDYATIAYRG